MHAFAVQKKILIRAPWFNERIHKLSQAFPLPKQNELRQLKNNNVIVPRDKFSWTRVNILAPLEKIKHLNFQIPCTQSSTNQQNEPILVEKQWKIRLRLSSYQKDYFFQHWFSLQRFFYNQTIKFLGAAHKLSNNDEEILKSIESKSILLDNRHFPTLSKLYAIKNAQHKYCISNNATLYKQRNDPVQTFSIPIQLFCWNEQNFIIGNNSEYMDIGPICPYKKNEFSKMKQYISKISSKSDMVTFQYERPGRYYVIIPYQTHMKQKNNCCSKKDIIALDPGVKTFQTGYDSQGIFQDHGVGAASRFVRLDQKKTKFLINHQKKKAAFIQLKIKDLRKDMHCKLVNFFAQTYTDVLLPKFSTNDIEKNGNLSSDSIAQMKYLGHDEFRNRLLQKMKEYNRESFQVHIVGEEYTSKACGKCCYLFHELGGSRFYECYHCQNSFHRDRQAARNIFLKNVEQCCGMIPI